MIFSYISIYPYTPIARREDTTENTAYKNHLGTSTKYCDTLIFNSYVYFNVLLAQIMSTVLKMMCLCEISSEPYLLPTFFLLYLDTFGPF